MKPDDRGAAITAGREALRQGDVDRAASLAGVVLAQAPDNIEALEIKALVEVERGHDRAAEQTLRSVISIAPDRRWSYADLSRLLLKQGRKSDAREVSEAAIAADAQNADAHAMLAMLLAEIEQWFEAAAHFRQALEIAGAHPQLLTGLGQALLRLGQNDEARQLLEAASAADADALEPVVYLAELEERLGAFAEAERLLNRAEQLAVRRGTDVDLQRSVLLARMGKAEQAYALLEAKPDLSGAALLHRGRLAERLGRYAEAWSDWTVGKAQLALRSSRDYAADQVNAQAELLARFFDSPAAADAQRAERKSNVPQPIFVIGFPRSGTTLVEQILASHSAIRAGGELPFGEELRDLALAADADYAALTARLAAPACAERFRDLYLRGAEARGLLDEGASYFTDKMPDNAFSLPLLRLAFPDAAVILVRRHPLDVITSVMAHDMTHGFNCAYLVEDAARHYALVDDLLERFSASGFGPTYELRYESLIENQSGETSRLMAALGLEIEPGQLYFHERESVPSTPSYAQVREPLNDRSIGRWRNFAAQLEGVTPMLAEAMSRGGYAP